MPRITRHVTHHLTDEDGFGFGSSVGAGLGAGTGLAEFAAKAVQPRETLRDQHKNHHIIALETGQWIGYPNNRLIWHDESWITPAPNKEWETPTHNYFVEGR